MLRLIPIIGKPLGAANTGAVLAALRNVAFATQRRLMTYPPARTSYRRTGELGRRWTVVGPKMEGTTLSVVVSNNLSYAKYVEGFKSKPPRQVKWAAGYGWPAADVVGKEEWQRALPSIREALKPK